MKKQIPWLFAMLVTLTLSAQRFTGEPTKENVEGKKFSLKNRQTGRYLSVWDGNQTNICMRSYTAPWEHWAFFYLCRDESKGVDYFVIVNCGLGGILDIEGNKPAGDGTLAMFNQFNRGWNQDDQVWYLTRTPDGYYQIHAWYNDFIINGYEGFDRNRIKTQDPNNGEFYASGN